MKRADDPVTTDPEHYAVIFENDRVRVLEYRDKPGDRTSPHSHPDSFMYTLGAFDRRISAGGREVDVSLRAGEARWVGAQEHAGENIGSSPSHAIFVELKEARPSGLAAEPPSLGPTGG